jgi:uncharacterized protein YozE (UPF0346 family)
MGVLEQVMGMKRQGMSDMDIFNELSQNRVPPNEIKNALKQAEIKSVVSGSMEGRDELQPSIMPEGEGAPVPVRGNHNSGEVYQPGSYESGQGGQNYQQSEYPPAAQEGYAPQSMAPSQQEYPQESYQQYQQPQEEQFYSPGAGGYEYSAGINTDTVMEVADQVFSDKIKKFQKQLENTSEIAALLQTKVENISDRLKKIETMMDKLQIAILEKIGSYGQNLEGIKKEMSMMQDSFSKMVSRPREPKEKQKKSSK